MSTYFYFWWSLKPQIKQPPILSNAEVKTNQSIYMLCTQFRETKIKLRLSLGVQYGLVPDSGFSYWVHLFAFQLSFDFPRIDFLFIFFRCQIGTHISFWYRWRCHWKQRANAYTCLVPRALSHLLKIKRWKIE